MRLVPRAPPAARTCWSRSRGTLCGLDLVRAGLPVLDPRVAFERRRRRTATRSLPGIVGTLEGPARAVLTGERLALNLLGHLSGIATLTRRYVDAVAGTRATILDTRKTTPGLRAAEKWAVRCGGGTNHRMGLHDAVLIKDNHLLFAADLAPAVIGRPGHRPAGGGGVRHARPRFAAALAAGADRILLDNMSIDQLTRGGRAASAGRIPLEASGGVTLDTVGAIARTGVDYISVGALTHSARSLDVSMEVLR